LDLWNGDAAWHSNRPAEHYHGCKKKNEMSDEGQNEKTIHKFTLDV